MSLDTDFLDEKGKIIEIDMRKNIKEGEQLFGIGRNIYIQPTLERTETGFMMRGTPVNYELPLFTIELDFDKRKVKATIKGESVPFNYRDEVEKILLDNF